MGFCVFIVSHFCTVSGTVFFFSPVSSSGSGTCLYSVFSVKRLKTSE